jgi:hypothetical protein
MQMFLTVCLNTLTAEGDTNLTMNAIVNVYVPLAADDQRRASHLHKASCLRHSL